jgi:hypothetical protein
MSDIHQIHEVGVDQRDETVTTQQPGYAMTEQVKGNFATNGLAVITKRFAGHAEQQAGLRAEACSAA